MSKKKSRDASRSTSNVKTRYISVGTIRLRIDETSEKKIFFTPKSGYSISHGGKSYLALLNADAKNKCGILVCYNSDNGLQISVNREFSSLVEIATKQKLVEIEIIKKSDDCSCDKCDKCSCKKCKEPQWLLHAITVPAAG